MDPGVELVRALAGVLIDEAVGPLAQRRLDETLGLAVGLRSVGSSEAMFDLQLAAGLGEVFGTKRPAVVGNKDRKRPDARPRGIVGTRPIERDGGAFGQGRQRLHLAVNRSLTIVPQFRHSSFMSFTRSVRTVNVNRPFSLQLPHCNGCDVETSDPSSLTFVAGIQSFIGTSSPQPCTNT